MRHVIYLLLVANVVYFAWHLAQGTPQEDALRALPPLPANIKPLVTLQEREQERKGGQDASDIEKLTETNPPGAGIPATCHTLGPFMATAELESVEDTLAKLGFDPKIRTSDVKEHVGYWVYLPAMKREEALQAARTLDRSEVKDYYIGQENFISLGTFAAKDRAEKHRDNIRQLGFEPQVEPRYATHTAHWLDIADMGEDFPGWGKLEEEYPDIRLQGLECR